MFKKKTDTFQHSLSLLDLMKVLQSLHGHFSSNHCSSVIRQKGEPRNGCFKKAKHAKISEKQIFLTP